MSACTPVLKVGPPPGTAADWIASSRSRFVAVLNGPAHVGDHALFPATIGEDPDATTPALPFQTPSTMRMSRSAAFPSSLSAAWYPGLSCAAVACAALSNSITTTRWLSPAS